MNVTVPDPESASEVASAHRYRSPVDSCDLGLGEAHDALMAGRPSWLVDEPFEAVVPSEGLHRTDRATWNEVRRGVRCCLTGHAFGVETFDVGRGSWSAERGTCDRWRVRAKEGGASYARLQVKVDEAAEFFLGSLVGRQGVHAREGLGDPGVASRGAWRDRYEGQHLVASGPCGCRAPSRRRTRESCELIGQRGGRVRRTWRA